MELVKSVLKYLPFSFSDYIKSFFLYSHLIGIVRDKLNQNIVVRITMISDVYNINVNCY